jgi:carbon storage regulator
MLLLTRKVGESIVIDEKIICTFLGYYQGDHIKLGFDAPPSVPINRYEIHRRIINQFKAGVIEHQLDWNETVIERLTMQIKAQQEGLAIN